MSRREELTNEQWAILEPLIPKPVRRADGKGRPEKHTDRAVLNGVLWVLRTGATRGDLPDRFPLGSICLRSFSRWVNAEVMRHMLEASAQDLERRGGIDLSEEPV